MLYQQCIKEVREPSFDGLEHWMRRWLTPAAPGAAFARPREASEGPQQQLTASSADGVSGLSQGCQVQSRSGSPRVAACATLRTRVCVAQCVAQLMQLNASARGCSSTVRQAHVCARMMGSQHAAAAMGRGAG